MSLSFHSYVLEHIYFFVYVQVVPLHDENNSCISFCDEGKMVCTFRSCFVQSGLFLPLIIDQYIMESHQERTV